MIDLSYISFIFAIIVFYIPFINSQKQQKTLLEKNIDSASSETLKKEIKKINSKIKHTKIFFFLGTAIVTFLYFYYQIKHIFLTIIFPTFKKMFPFKFSNGNFKFSFIFETVLLVVSIVILMFLVAFLSYIVLELSKKAFFIMFISLSIFAIFGLIWLNVFLSNFLCSNISNHFYIISSFFSIGVYCIIWFLLFILTMLLATLYEKRKERMSQKRKVIAV